jgi:regulator-associated protein of mTOR
MCPRFYRRSLLCDSLDYSLIDKIPGRQNDRKTLLGELNWIFTAVTDTIAWNVLPRGSFFLVKNDFLIFHMCTSSDLVLHLSLSLLHVDNT